MGEEAKTVDQKDESAAIILSAEEKAEDSQSFSKPPPTSLKDAAEHVVGKTGGMPKDRDGVLAQVQIEKKLSLIKAWEENEKTKADNKAHKKLSAVDAWENTKRAAVEAQLKQIEEKFEKKKAEYAEKMKNKEALVRKAAEEKRAMIVEDRAKDFLKAEEMAAKYRTSGSIPANKSCACFSC